MDCEDVDDVLRLTMDSKDEDEENPYDDILHPDDYKTLRSAEDDEKHTMMKWSDRMQQCHSIEFQSLKYEV
ncbi:Hypothetical predicted protein [Octopus vulgaris]|uniref:Uncharacterized protein n=1 Tax=Octopus vulgaris TaxID=6645 RepID=A0AA36BFT4_OCTVU|nr:Hypothetical predicted protein [Octopus vulgaris]